jgi:hypothetical protein
MTGSRTPSGLPAARQARFVPPMAGGERKTGWEALDKWVKSEPTGTAGAAEGAGMPAGAEASREGAADRPGAGEAAGAGADRGQEAGRGGMAWLRRLFRRR